MATTLTLENQSSTTPRNISSAPSHYILQNSDVGRNNEWLYHLIRLDGLSYWTKIRSVVDPIVAEREQDFSGEALQKYVVKGHEIPIEF